MGQILASSRGTKQTSSVLSKHKATQRTEKTEERKMYSSEMEGVGVGGLKESDTEREEVGEKNEIEEMERRWRGTQRSLESL